MIALESQLCCRMNGAASPTALEMPLSIIQPELPFTLALHPPKLHLLSRDGRLRPLPTNPRKSSSSCASPLIRLGSDPGPGYRIVPRPREASILDPPEHRSGRNRPCQLRSERNQQNRLRLLRSEWNRLCWLHHQVALMCPPLPLVLFFIFGF